MTMTNPVRAKLSPFKVGRLGRRDIAYGAGSVTRVVCAAGWWAIMEAIVSASTFGGFCKLRTMETVVDCSLELGGCHGDEYQSLANAKGSQ